jgi:hypothetical protein
MVFVDKKSPLINLEDIKNQNIFCYYANQQRTCYLMKLSTIAELISKKFSLKIEIREGQFQMFGKKHPFEGLLKRIQDNKCSLIAFYGDHAFVCHQTSQFIYHQLKLYYDLILFIKMG